MRSTPLHSRLVSIVLALLAVGAWLYLAPAPIGGSTDYVTTRGDSMAPRFETGDLALIRPADDYRVGDVVAYRSAVLRTVVLHRIVARDGDRYVLKGDNNDFLDPTHPGRGEMIGRLWLRIPRAGLVLGWLRTPAVVAVLAGGVALLLLNSGRRRRRRDSRRGGATRSLQGNRLVMNPRLRPVRHLNAQQVLSASAVAAAAFLLLGLLAFTRPATEVVAVKTPYTEQVKFGYRADAPDGPVYAGGVVRTGDPVFLRIVDEIEVTVDYRFAAIAPHRLTGSQEMLVRLSSPTGWSRDLPLESPTRFKGNNARTEVKLDIGRLQSLIAQVETLTGAPAGGDYTVAVIPRTHVTGTLAGQRLDSEFAPALSFQLNAVQLRPGGDVSTTSEGLQEGGLAPSRRGNIASATASSFNRLGVAGHGLPVAIVRWIALVGLLLAGSALLAAWRQSRRPSDPIDHIQARYGHLIVPIVGMTPDPAHPPIDVTSIDALVQLAERSERLILHQHHEDADVYLVDDEGTIYRYRTRPSGDGRHSPGLSVAPSSETTR